VPEGTPWTPTWRGGSVSDGTRAGCDGVAPVAPAAATPTRGAAA
jgi:hypothetical protein